MTATPRQVRDMSQEELDAYLDVTGGCSGECYGWRRRDDPATRGCGKPTCEGPVLTGSPPEPGCPSHHESQSP